MENQDNTAQAPENHFDSDRTTSAASTASFPFKGSSSPTSDLGDITAASTLEEALEVAERAKIDRSKLIEDISAR